MSASSVASAARTSRNSRSWPFTKLRQLVRLVRESHAQPMTGAPQKPVAVAATEVGVTFIGHSSFLVQMAGKNILIDPVFATRLVLLRRQRHPGILPADLPAIDLVLITHAHMDHLNLPSLRAVLRNNHRLHAAAPAIVVPGGVDDLVRRLGFDQLRSMSWWDELALAGLRITMTPSQHWGARMFKDTHRQFGGYALTPVDAAQHGSLSLYHSGDTAYFNGFREIGRRLRPDIALLPIGAYFPDTYRSVHTSPEEAVHAFLDLRAQTMIPMHYGTFRLGREPMDEPLQRLAAEAIRLHLDDRIRTVAEGETVRMTQKGLASASGEALQTSTIVKN